MKEIELTKGYKTQVDDVDYEWLSQWKWHVNYHHPGRVYVVGYCGRGGHIPIYMHRYIVGAMRGQQVDHVNGNGLDNQRHNLRVCTSGENACNRGAQINNTSGWKGVSWYRAGQKWVAMITIDRKQTYLGYFDDPVQAALCYDDAARKHHGKFARTNFIDV